MLLLLLEGAAIEVLLLEAFEEVAVLEGEEPFESSSFEDLPNNLLKNPPFFFVEEEESEKEVVLLLFAEFEFAFVFVFAFISELVVK